MKLTKCVNGHFYDAEKFESCPHCAGGSKLDVNEIFGGTPSAPKPAMSKVERDDDMTVPLEWTPEETPAEEPAAAAVPTAESASSTAVPTGSVENAAEEKVEETQSDVEAGVDIQSQPSFDTPLDFDADFEEGTKTVEEEAAEEPKEEFELLSKFDSNQADAEELDVTTEPKPFTSPEPEAVSEPEPFASPEPEAVSEPEPFVSPEPEAVSEPEPFASPEPEAVSEPEPFASPEPEAVSEPEPFASLEPEAVSEPEPFVSPESVQTEWEMPQPNVEEISTGDFQGISNTIDPELEDKPTEIVNEVGLPDGVKAEPGPFVTPEEIPATEAPVPSAPSPAAAMFGASADDDDDEHTVAFYDEIFVSKAPETPVIPDTAAPIPESPAVSAVPFSETSVEMPEDTAGIPEPEVFTAPPLQPAQALPTPCVGWLIALNGSHIGQDFHLRVGKNYIGRDTGMDIALTGDKSVSRNKHAIVIYEPKHHKYFIQPGESNELVYVNDEVVLLPMPLKPYDVIVIGDIELWFMPLCDDQHNWSEVIRRLQEQM